MFFIGQRLDFERLPGFLTRFFVCLSARGRCYWVFTEFFLVAEPDFPLNYGCSCHETFLLDSDPFYWVLPSFFLQQCQTRFCCLLALGRCYWVLPSFSWSPNLIFHSTMAARVMKRFCWIVIPFTGFYLVFFCSNARPGFVACWL